MLLNEIEYTFSERITDLHLGLIETYLNNLTDGKIASEAGFFLKYVVFDKPLPDELIEKIEDRYIIFMESSTLLEIYKNLYYRFTDKNLKERIKIETDPEKKALLEKARDNLSKAKTRLDSVVPLINGEDESDVKTKNLVKKVIQELELSK